MVFKCQEDSFLREFTSKVTLCEKTKWIKKINDSQEECINGYNVILEDTILFPEGGGQPCDRGYLNDKPVINVQRKGKDAYHFVACLDDTPPFSHGESVNISVDWNRRHDHMQQHSGQHLITSIFEREYGVDTKSWSLRPEDSYIELDASIDVPLSHISFVEKMCNDLIAAATPVSVHVLNENSNLETPEVKRLTRGLPKDHVGDVRVITIEGVESNMCCGTHVTNLAQLNCIKLLNIEKTKNRQFLLFLVGNRVLKRLHGSFERECQLNNLLNGGFQSHVDLIKKIQANQKSSQRTLQNCLKEIAVFEANKLKALAPVPKWYTLHRKDGIYPDFINAFLRNSTIDSDLNELSLLFLTVGEENSQRGHIVLYGNDKIVNDLGPKLCEILDGKGNSKGQRFQGKVNNLKGLPACEKIISKYFEK